MSSQLISLPSDIRELVCALTHAHITAVLAAFDTHDPGILDGVYRCRGACKWQGTEAEWNAHLADALADALVAS